MSVSLYRKYRPQNFAGIIGQSAAVSVLTNSIAKKRVGHAYLFSGSRGCGKTSAARIFAKAINCEDPQGFEPCGKCRNCTEITAGDSLDVIEIDGASNNGVDSIRGLKENVALAPFNSRYKIYIIDEVHMLSQGAFNALLKTLEEPPDHVIFIMATTEPHKVPVTIRSRCQHIPFHSITPDDIYLRLEYVCKNENITFEAEALREISRQADGALRDALSLLEQVSASGDVTLANVESVFGAGSRTAFEKLIAGLRENPEESYAGLKNIFSAGASGVRVFEELFSLVRDLWLVSKWKNIAGDLGLSEPEKKFLVDESQKWKPEELHHMLKSILKILTEARIGMRNDILLGMFMLSLEPEEDMPTPKRESSRAKFTPSAKTESPQPESQKTETPPPVLPSQPEDPELKAKVLDVVHEKNFAVYCAVLDAKIYARENDLVLEMTHRYCYETLKQERTAVELAGMFADYGKVILRFGLSEYICPEYVTVAPETVQKTSRPKKTEKTPDETPADESHAQNIMAASESQPAKQTPSAFGDILHRLKGSGFNPEVILLRRNESAESENDTEDTPGELTPEDDD